MNPEAPSDESVVIPGNWDLEPMCTLEEYRAVVRDLPRPRPDQIAAFVEYVRGCHSWHKHLPPHRHGVVWIFFISPLAGRKREFVDKRLVFRRYEPEDRWHYNFRMTEDYLQQFGHFATGGADLQFTPGTIGCERLFHRGGAPILPMEVLSAGAAWVSSHVHVRCGSLNDFRNDRYPRDVESEAERTAWDRQMQEYDEALARGVPKDTLISPWHDWVLEERARLHHAVKSAADRAVELAFGT